MSRCSERIYLKPISNQMCYIRVPTPEFATLPHNMQLQRMDLLLTVRAGLDGASGAD